MGGPGPPQDDDGADGATPMRKIDDATYGRPPAGPIRRRLTRAKRWFQLDANRWVVAAVMLCGVFVGIVVTGSLGPVSVQSFLVEGISPGAVLVELLKAIVSVVVIVLAINQLVLSPGLGPAGDQRERFEETMDLRERLEEHADVRASPTSPARFLELVVEAVLESCEDLRDAVAESGNSQLRDDVEAYADELAEEAGAVESIVADSHFGGFETISAVLRLAISEKVRRLRDVRAAHDLSPAEARAFDELEDRLELFTVAREYLKTVYVRSEYIELSEGLLYTGLPSILVTYLAAQIYAPSVFPGTTVGIETQLLFVAGAVTVALAPFALMVSFVFRLAAVSRSTLFVGPFAARADPDGFDEG